MESITLEVEMLAELLVNLPGQSKGNIGEVLRNDDTFITLEMIDRSVLTVLPKDVRMLEDD